MALRRRTAVLLCAGALLAAAAGAALLALRPARLRGIVRDQLQAALAPGFDAEIDAASWSLDDGLIAEGLRVVRRADRAVLLRAGRVEVGTRLHEFLRRRRVTDVRVIDPEIVLERAAGEPYPLVEAFRVPAPAVPDAGPLLLPRVRVEGGTVRWSDPDVLAPGHAVVLRVERAELQERRGRRPSMLEALLVEEGGGAGGSLGRITVRGPVPPTGADGLSVLVHEFEVGDALRGRLAPAVLARAERIAMEGWFGSAEGLPGLEVSVRAPGDGATPVVGATLRPRDLAVLALDFPLLFTSVAGEIRWDGEALDLDSLSLRRDGASFGVKGRLVPGGPGGPRGRLDFFARDLYLDAGIRAALPAAARRVWDAYDLDGTVDVTQAPRDGPGSFDSFVQFDGSWEPSALKVAVALRDGGVAYKGYLDDRGVRHGFDFRVTELTGGLVVEARPGETSIFLDRVAGRRGAVPVTAEGRVRDLGRGRAEVLVHVHARDVPLDDDIRRAFGDPADFDRWAPRGTAALVHVRVDQHPDLDRTAHESVFVHLDGRASFAYDGFPLRLDRVSGVVELVKDRVEGRLVPRTTFRGLEAARGEGRLAIDGTVEGAGDGARLAISVRARGIDLADGVEDALRESPAAKAALASWAALRPSGPVDCRAEISGTVAHPREQFRFDLRGASAQGWDPVRIPLRDLEGVVEIAPEAVTLRGVRGEGPDGPVRLDGEIRDPGGAALLDLAVEADGLRLDGSLREALGRAGDGFAGYWEVVRPAPGLAGDARVRLRGPATSPEVSLDLDGIRGGVAPLGLRNLDLGEGSVRYADGLVTIDGIAGSMADRELRVAGGRIDLRAGEAALSVEVRRLRFPRDLAGLLADDLAAAVERLAPDRYFHVPDLRLSLTRGWRRVALDGTLSLSPRRQGVSPGLGLEGIFRLEGLTFDLPAVEGGGPVGVAGSVTVSRGVVLPGLRIEELGGRFELSGATGAPGADLRARMTDGEARVEGRALRGAAADIGFGDGTFRVAQLRGGFAGGTLGASFEAGGRPAYRGRFSLVGADARELLDPSSSSSEIRGTVGGDLEIRNPTGEIARLAGEGRLDLVDGRLLDIPVMEGIFNLLSKGPLALLSDEVPGRVSRVAVKWRHAGDRMIFDEVLLDAPAVALHKSPGRSEAWLDGRLDIGLNPEFKILGIGGRILGLFLGPIAERVYKVQVGGTVRNPQVSHPILPGLLSRDGGTVRFEPPEPFVEFPPLPPWEF